MKCPICDGGGIITIEADDGSDKRTGCVACKGTGTIGSLIAWVKFAIARIKHELGILG